MSLKLTGLLHAAVIVTDLDRSVEFYSQVIGLERIDRDLKYPGAWYQIGGAQVHLIVDANYQYPRSIDLEASTRHPHIALGTEDLAGVKSRLLAADYPVKMSNSGRAALFVLDPDGNAIEFSEHTPDAHAIA
jgi:glyoxylase I family protein